MNRHLSAVVRTVTLAATFAFASACGSGSDPGCVSNDTYLCAKDLGAFPFAQAATIVSDVCEGRQCAGVDPPAGATTMSMTHPEAGKLCLSGWVAPGGFAVIGLEFPLKNQDDTKILQPFDAVGRGITQVALT